MSCWTDQNKFKASFISMIVLTLLLSIGKIFVGYKEKSLSLTVDSFHLFYDLPALVVGYSALKFTNETVDGTYTFGRVRAEILGAIVNTVFLIAICFSLAVESMKRLFIPDSIHHPESVLIVGIISLIVNGIGLVLFRCSGCRFKRSSHHANPQFSMILKSNKDKDACQRYSANGEKQNSKQLSEFATPNELNIHGVFLHILQHVFVALIVVTSALIVMFAKGAWTLYVDPTLGLIVVCIVLRSSFPLLKECLMTLMQTVPAALQLQNMEGRLLQSVPEVSGVHELHIWQLAGNQVVGSAHIVFQSHKMYNDDTINRIEDFFVKEGLSSITVQPEFTDLNTTASMDELANEDCLLVCAEKKCANLTCCATPKKILAKLHQH